MKNFTGDIDLKSGKLVGVASEIVSDYFDLEGKTAVQLENSGLDEIKVSDLIMSDFTANNGVLKTEKPQTMEAKISSPAKVYGFKGSMDYSNGTATISGTSSMIQANGLTIGISQIK
jgi:hypothetical protein